MANKPAEYWLGTGNYKPQMVGGQLVDTPWTQTTDKTGLIHTGSDCAGFAICWCYKLPRHRPGYDRNGAFGDVEDDINCNSVLGDAIGDVDHPPAHDLFTVATGMPQPGDLLVYPTIRLAGHPLPFIGHVGIVVSTGRLTSWDVVHPRYDLLDVAQCCGGDGRSPAVLLTDGSAWAKHHRDWPKPEHTVYVVRAIT
jgi:hypothetical protein